MIRRAFLSQWVALRRPRLLFGVLAAMVAAAVLSTALAISQAGQAGGQGGPGGAASTVGEVASSSGIVRGIDGSAALLGAIALAVGASVVAGEFSTGMIRNLLIRQPHRARLLAGRWLGIASHVAGAAVLAVLVSVATAFVAAGVRGIDTSAWVSSAGVEALLGSLVGVPAAIVGYAALGAALGVLLRSPALAIGIGLAWVLPLEAIVSASWGTARDVLPGQLLGAVAQGGTSDVSLAAAIAGGLVWAVGLAVVAGTTFVRRDVLS